MNEATATVEERIQLHKKHLLELKIIASVSPHEAALAENMIRIKKSLIKFYEKIKTDGAIERYDQWLRNEEE